MMNKLKKDRYLFSFFLLLGTILIVLLIELLLVVKYDAEGNANFKRSYESYEIAGEMRQSSDDLTKMVRLYVLTGDKKYLYIYEEILGIREGVRSRPLDYNLIYWDFVVDPNKRPRPFGSAISLQQLMVAKGFTDKEIALIRESQQRSNALVGIEEEAIYAMQGLYNNGSGHYSIRGAPNPELARRLVSDSQYMEQKARIMEPLLAFSQEVRERTKNTQDRLDHLTNMTALWAIFFTFVATGVMIICLLKSRKMLAEAAKMNEDLLLSMLPKSIAEHFKQGTEMVAHECRASVLFVHIAQLENRVPSSYMNDATKIIEELSRKFGVEVIEKEGNNLMVVSGVYSNVKKNEVPLADFALALKTRISELSASLGSSLEVRMGMAVGTVIAGVGRNEEKVYDLWGDVVSLANMLQVTAGFREIQLAEPAAHALQELFDIEEKGFAELPGIGVNNVFLLKGRKT